MEQKFHFVDVMHSEKSSRRLMRRHVMKGKNAGRTLHRSSRLGKQVGLHRLPPYSLARTIGNGNPVHTFSFPVEVTPSNIKAIDDFFAYTSERIYPVQLDLNLDEAKKFWLKSMFSDETSYHCSLALMQASNEIFLGKGDASPVALYHLSKALAQEQMRRHHLAAEVHVMGLKRIVDLRGGLDKIQEQNMPIALKICKTDIMVALEHGGHPLFSRDCTHVAHDLLAAKGLHLERSSDAYSTRHNRLDPTLHEILSDIMGMCTVFNNNLQKKPLDVFTFQEALVSICYRLLHYRSLNESRDVASVQSAHHVGMTIFMMSIFLQYDQRRIIKYGLISLCVKDAVESWLDEREHELALWLLVMGGIWGSGAAGDDWAVPKLQETAQQLGLVTWEGAKRVLRKFPWLDAVHDRPGRQLWDQTFVY